MSDADLLRQARDGGMSYKSIAAMYRVDEFEVRRFLTRGGLVPTIPSGGAVGSPGDVPGLIDPDTDKIDEALLPGVLPDDAAAGAGDVVALLADGTPGWLQAQKPRSTYPRLTFTSVQSTPVLTKADFTIPTGLYGPRIIDLKGKLLQVLWPGGYRYLCTLSTNHDDTLGGGCFVAGSHDLVTWEPIQAARVYVDTVAGFESETFFPVWDEFTAQFFVYYQQAGVGANQATVLATTPDLVTGWERHGVVIEPPGDGTLQPGDGHTGYGLFTDIADGYYFAKTLYGGGTSTTNWAFWRSRDRVNWVMDPDVLVSNADLTLDPLRRVAPGMPFFMDGIWYGVAADADQASGSAKKDNKFVVGPITQDFRHFIGVPHVAWQPQHAWESTDLQGYDLFIADDGTPWMAYICGNDMGIARGVWS